MLQDKPDSHFCDVEERLAHETKINNNIGQLRILLKIFESRHMNVQKINNIRINKYIDDNNKQTTLE
ncbi:hypothetical protein Btru_077896 [Bulinus truncatus]|nr:hypothetical protein Btru_077896 [Bulinus truncatus]